MKTPKLLSIAGLVVLLSGCAAEVVSSKAITIPSNTFNKINVVYSQQHLKVENGKDSYLEVESTKFGNGILKTLPEIYKKNGISSASGKIQNEETLGNEKLKELFHEEKSEVPVLVVTPVAAEITCYQTCITKFSVKTSLYELTQGRIKIGRAHV